MERLKTMAILALLAALAGSIALAATGSEAEVRISARQLEDGRVEFALQQRVDGEWGERTLPSSRYFPADVGHNRWLNSTSMTVSVSVAGELTEEPTVSTDSQPPAEPQRSDIRTQVGRGATPNGAIWAVWLDEFTDERGALVVSPTDSDSSIYEPALVFRCSENGTKLEAWFNDLPVSDINDRYAATIRWDSFTAQTTSLYENATEGYGHFVDNPQRYRSNVTNHDMLRVRFTGYSDTVTATIDVSAIRGAPTWPNILACGN